VRTTFLPSLVVSLVLAVAACGGKIAGDNGHTTGGSDPTAGGGQSSSGFDPSTAPSGSAQPSSPFTPSTPPPPTGLPQPSGGHTVGDACAAICERNGTCGAGQSDCEERCTSEIDGALSCASQANAYIHCYADNLVDGCAALPPVCESDYCAYTICAGKVVPSYCRPR
jgi:hypothetical protein